MKRFDPLACNPFAMVRHTVLLRSDGVAVACGRNSQGQCNIPPLDEGLSYSHVSAGYDHTVLLRSDGRAVCCGQNDFGQCDIPPLQPGGSGNSWCHQLP